MLIPTKRAFLIAAAALALPIGANAQQRAAVPTQAQPTPAQQQEIQTAMTELQQIGVKLQAAQVQALKDPALAAEQEKLGAEVKAALIRVDPSLAQMETRAQAMDTEARKATEANDSAKLQQLTNEARQMQARFMAAQQKAFQQPDLAAKLQVFQTRLEARMLQVEPQMKTLIQRGEALQIKLQTAMQSQARAPGQP